MRGINVYIVISIERLLRAMGKREKKSRKVGRERHRYESKGKVRIKERCRGKC